METSHVVIAVLVVVIAYLLLNKQENIGVICGKKGCADTKCIGAWGSGHRQCHCAKCRE